MCILSSRKRIESKFNTIPEFDKKFFSDKFVKNIRFMKVYGNCPFHAFIYALVGLANEVAVADVC